MRSIITSVVLSLMVFAFMEVLSPGYTKRFFLSVDQFANTVFFGDEDETISSRLGRAQKQGNHIANVSCAFLDIFDESHCEKSIEK